MLITGISQLVTNFSGVPGDLGIIRDAAVVITDDTIAWVGPASDIPRIHRDAEVFDVGGGRRFRASSMRTPTSCLPGTARMSSHAGCAGSRTSRSLPVEAASTPPSRRRGRHLFCN